MKNVLLLLLVLTFSICLRAKNEMDQYRYEIESYQGDVSAAPGCVIIKVWNYGKKEQITRRLCIRNAVHGLIFKGYFALNARSADKGHSALCPEGYEAHKKYFDSFFKDEKFLKYVDSSNKGVLPSGDVIKIAKREYKIGMIVVVNFNALRKQLEKDGIVKSLDYLFK